MPTASAVAFEEVELLCLARHDFAAALGLWRVRSWRVQKIQHEITTGKRDDGKHRDPVYYSDLEMRQLLGEGSFGSVRLVVHQPTGGNFAMKSMHKGHLIASKQAKATVAEFKILKWLDESSSHSAHPFICAVHEAYNAPKHVMFLMDLVPGGELFSLLAKARVLSQSATALYVAMVGSALGYLSARKIAHRDVKLENLLFDDKGYLKLVDFGFAKKIESRTFTFCGTPDYMAPDILTGKGHNYAVDWWSLGVLTYELVHGQSPFDAPDQMATFRRIRGGKYKIHSSVGLEVSDVIRRLLAPNPFKRLGMLAGAEKGLLAHPLCAHIDVDAMLQRELPTLPYVPSSSSPGDLSNFGQCAGEHAAMAKKYERSIDARWEPVWEREFGPCVIDDLT